MKNVLNKQRSVILIQIMISKRIKNLIIPIILLSCLRGKVEFNSYTNVLFAQRKHIVLLQDLKGNDTKSCEAERQNNLDHDKELSRLTNGIFWSDYAELLVPKGLSFNESMQLIQKLRTQRVKSIRRASQSVCGSGRNGKVQLADDIQMCARNEKYKLSVYAEALTFYLSRLLRMDNVPEVILATANSSSARWNDLDISKLNWKDNQTVALIKWLDNARLETFMPPVITNAYKTGNPVTSNIITQYTKPLLSKPHSVAELIQWGTIIVFDNLIGHYDRLVLYQSVGQLGNSRRSLERGLYNSLKSPNGKLWLIDNESAFFYQSKYQDPTYKYTQLLKFNDRILQTVCIFQSSIVAELRRLSIQPSAFRFLFDFAGSFEPLLANVIKDPRFELFAKIFNTRLGQILEWVEHCQTLYNAT